MREQHVDPDEAVQIMEDLGAVRALGIHWGIFQLTDEARGEPPKLLLNALRRRGISPHLFPAGEPGLQYEATSMSDGTHTRAKSQEETLAAGQPSILAARKRQHKSGVQ